MSKSKKGVIIEGVKLLSFNDGEKTEINNNEDFCHAIQVQLKHADVVSRLEEYFFSWVEMYRQEDDTYAMYYTVVHSDDDVDGYVVHSSDPTLLFHQLAVSRGVCADGEYIQELIEYAVKSEVMLTT